MTDYDWQPGDLVYPLHIPELREVEAHITGGGVLLVPDHVEFPRNDDEPIDYERLFSESEWSTYPMPGGWRPTIDLAPEAGAGHD